MKFRPLKQAPVLITAGVIALVCLARLAQFDLFDRLERMTYDWRARSATYFPAPAATNLGFVYISDDSITALNNGSLGFRYGLYWPRHIYGRVLRELSTQGAKAVGLDIMFPDARPDQAPVKVSTVQWPDLLSYLATLPPKRKPASYQDEVTGEKLTLLESDDYFAWQLKLTRLGVLAAKRGVLPLPLFADQALALGDISAEPDADGVLRRARAFQDYRRWHPAFKQVEADPDFAVDLNKVRLEPGKIVLLRTGLPDIPIPVDAENNFQLSDFGTNLPPGSPTTAKAFTTERVWHLGLVLAAQSLGINLANARVDLPHGRITLHSADSRERIIPVDRDGYFYVNWELKPSNPMLTTESFESLLQQDTLRTHGETNGLSNHWKDKLVVIGSTATGNDLTDRGATPLEKNTFLVSKHWNVANALITNRFIRPSGLPLDLGLIALLGVGTAFLTWRLRALPGLVGSLLLAAAYAALCVFLFVAYRLWLPMVLPIVGAVVVEYGLLVTYRVVFEQREQRRVKSVFSRIVSPDVVTELLEAESLSLGGARREVTVMFADVRGFTEITDQVQEQTTAYIQQKNLTGRAAEARYDQVAEQMLQTISLYLGFVADTVKKHGGTLDKYIGDCAMAFWGAPKPNRSHASLCVRAAIEAQRGIHALNEKRQAENAALEIENRARLAAGQPPRPLLPVLLLGTGINSGAAMVGLMGSDTHGLNYTVLGREVNLASRLETVSGRGRIIIGEATYQHILRTDPALATTCVEQEPTTPKGFLKAVRNYEVPWRTDIAPPASPAS